MNQPHESRASTPIRGNSCNPGRAVCVPCIDRLLPSIFHLPSSLLLAPLLLALAASPAHAAFKASLVGQSSPTNGTWTGNLSGWVELQYIPCQVQVSGGPVTNFLVSFPFDHSQTTGSGPPIPGIEGMFFPTNSANVIITSGPTTTGVQGQDSWTYSFTITVTNGNPGAVGFSARLAAGSHNFPGGSLHIDSGGGGLGTVQISKPGVGPGLPALAMTKTGPSIVNPGSLITYTLTYTNKGGTNAYGVQLSDTLPGVLSFNNCTGGCLLNGAQVIWDLGNLAIGQGGTVSYTVTVTNTVTSGTVFTNSALIASSQNDADPADDSASVSTTVTNGCIGPSIFTNPTGATNCAGASVTFSVSASGSSLAYQWRKNTSPILGATASSYAIGSITSTNAGTYDVVVTNSCGNVTSSGAVLSVNSLTTATGPSSQAACAGSGAAFNTTAAGTGPFSYQWTKNGTNIGGATTSAYSIASVTNTDAGTYTVQITGACNTVTNSATLTVNLCAYVLAGPTVAIQAPPDNSRQAPGTVLVSGYALASRPLVHGVPLTNSILLVTLNGQPVDSLDTAGNFFAAVTLVPGQNVLQVVATDALSLSTTNTLTIDGADCPKDFANAGNVSASTQAQYGRTTFNERTRVTYADVAIRNIGNFPIYPPLLVGVGHLNDPTVQVLGADGVSSDGISYYDFSAALTNSALGPGDLTLFRTLAFQNPGRIQFSYDLLVMGGLDQPPQFVTAPILQASVGCSYSYPARAADSDRDALSYSLLVSPAAMSVSPSGGLVSWVPGTNDLGNNDVILQASDGRGGVAQQHYVLTVVIAPSNRPPVFVSTPVVVAQMGTNSPSYMYQAQAIDPDCNQTLNYSLLVAPTNMTINAGTGLIQWNPAAGQLGNQTVTLLVQDGHGGSNTQSYVMCVLPPTNNLPPVIFSAAPSCVTPGLNFSYQVQAFDPDNDPLTFTLTRGPAGMTIDPVSGLLQWAAPTNLNSATVVVVQVSDGLGGVAEQDLSIAAAAASGSIAGTVWIDANANGVRDTNDFGLGGIVVFLDLNTNGIPDPGEPSTVSAVSTNPAVAGQYQFSCVPTGTNIVRVVVPPGFVQTFPANNGAQIATVSAGQATSGMDFGLSFSTNGPGTTTPVFLGGPTQAVVVVGQQYFYAPVVSDTGGGTLTFDLVIGPTGMVVAPDTGLVTWFPDSTQIGSQDALLRVRDANGGVALRSFQIGVVAATVSGGILPPVFTSVPPGPAVAGLPYQYLVQAMDPNGLPVTLELVSVTTLALAPQPPPFKFAINIGDTVTNGVPGPGAGNIETSQSLDVYTFTAAAAQKVFFNLQGFSSTNSSAFQNTEWFLVDPNGLIVFDLSFFQGDAGSYVLTNAGLYTLAVQGNVNGSTGTYGFKLWNVPTPDQFAISLGATITNGVPGPGAGNIESPGAKDIYSFSATPGTKVFFQMLGFQGSTQYTSIGVSANFSYNNWMLTGPTGAVLFNLCLGCPSPGSLTLTNGGTYTITVGSDQYSSIGTYSFQALNVPAPQMFTVHVGDTVTNGLINATPTPGAGDIESPAAKDVYTFTGNAGQKVYFQLLGLQPVGLGANSWTLADPTGAVLFSQPLLAGDPGSITLTNAGSYTLTVGSDQNPSTGTYGFELWNVPAPQQFSIQIGDTVTNALINATGAPGAGDIESPGAHDIYTFTNSAGQNVYFQMLGYSSSGVNNFTFNNWKLTDATGAVRFNQCLGCGNPGSITLTNSGTNTINVGSDNNPSTGTYGFQIRNSP